MLAILNRVLVTIFVFSIAGSAWAEYDTGKTLVVGSEEEYPPFSTGYSSETASGFTVELWKEVAKESGLKYTIRVLPFNQILQEFKEGKIDVLINLAQSAQRHQFASFTVPHVTVNGAIFERKGESGIRQESDLSKKTIIVLKADLAHDYAIAKGWGKQLVVADTAADCFKLLAEGKHDTILISKLVGLQTVRALKLKNIQALDIKAGFLQKFSFAVHKDNPDLLATINESFSIVKLNGTYDILYEKWFGIYEERISSFRDVQQFLVPLAIVLLLLLGIIFHKRKIELALRESNDKLEGRVISRTQELEAAKDLAELSSRAKGDFLANMSHEIRTPMNAIIGTLYLALKTDLDPRQRSYLERIHSSSKHLLGIINDILDFSKIEAGKLDIEAINFDLKNTLQNIVDQVSYKSVEKGIELRLEIDPNLPRYLHGDPLRLAQILINFTNNAVKFTDKGEIIVRARELEGDQHSSLIRFEVQDSGVGMSVEEQSKLFQSFQQGDTSTTRKFGGTGLGLVISKQLASLMEGDVGVISTSGLGSTFWFVVRLAFGKAPLELDSMTDTQQPPIWLKGVDILLAEDNLFNQQLAIDLLEDAGVGVIVASNGKEALANVRERSFDCILMDIQMPEMDGFETVRHMRMEQIRTPVIAMTANARREDRERCLAAGMNDFISKPIEPAVLYSILKKWLPKTAQQQRNSGTDPSFSSTCVPMHTYRPTIGRNLQTDANFIDLSILEKNCENNPARVNRYVSVFMESIISGIIEIDAALERGDVATLNATGHRIKSSARAVGALSLADICQSLEGVSIDDDLECARKLASQFRLQIEKIKSQIEENLGIL